MDESKGFGSSRPKFEGERKKLYMRKYMRDYNIRQKVKKAISDELIKELVKRNLFLIEKVSMLEKEINNIRKK